MLQSYTKYKYSLTKKNGQPIEINAKNGVISTYAKKHQIATPPDDMISLLLKYTNTKT